MFVFCLPIFTSLHMDINRPKKNSENGFIYNNYIIIIIALEQLVLIVLKDENAFVYLLKCGFAVWTEIVPFFLRSWCKILKDQQYSSK